MSPKMAQTFNAVCRLKTDSFDVGNFWVLHGGNVISFAEQKLGHKATQTITIPKKTFDRMIAWYLREQKLTK